MKQLLTVRSLVAAVVALLVVGYLARDFLARKAVESAIERQTGFLLRIDSMHVDAFGGRVDVRGLELMNPPEFAQRRFVSLPLLHAEYDTLSLLRREPHLSELTVHVDEVFIVTDAKGEKNTARLGRSATARAATKKVLPYRVDVLHVRVGKCVVEDLSRGKKTERTVALNIDRTYRNVTASTSLSELVLGSVFEPLAPVVGDVAKGLGGAFEGTGSEVRKVGKGLLERLRKKP